MRNRVTSFIDTATLLIVAGAAIASGDIVKAGNRWGVAQAAIASGDSGAIHVKGRFDLPKATGFTLAVGDRVGWDAVNSRVTTSLLGGRIGVVSAAAASGDTLVEVELDGDDSGYGAITAASTVVTATAAATKFDQQLTIPAGALEAGDEVEIDFQVTHVANNSTDTAAIKAFIGATEVLAIAAADPGTGGTSQGRIVVTIRTAGAAGTCVAKALAGTGAAAGAPTMLFKASQAINTTVANAVAIENTFSSTSAGNQARLDVLSVKVRKAA